MIINVSDREFHTILAALRHWESEIEADIEYKGLFDIASNGGEVKTLEVQEIDELCERINDSGPQVYLIQNKFVPELWWNNDSGWGSCAGADLFDGTEHLTLNAPIDGIWVPLEDLPIEVDRKEREVSLWRDAVKDTS